MDIQRIIYVIRAIGISGILRTIQYGLFRDRLENRVHAKLPHPSILAPGNISRINPIQGGLRVDFDNASVEIFFLTQQIIKVSWEPGKPPFSFTNSIINWAPLSVEINSDSSGHSLSCGKIVAKIDNAGGLYFRDLDGHLLKKDNPPLHEGDKWSVTTNLAAEEHIYGLGERASNFNLRPGSYRSWNTDAGGTYSHGIDPLYNGTPIYLSLSKVGCHLVYFENSYQSTFQIEDTLKASFFGGMLRYYVIFGSLESIYFQLGELIGRPDMPPQWALGYHQSRWGYRSEADIREIVEGFKKHDFPLSVIHLDIDYMDKFRVFTINSNRFPVMKQLASDFEDKGIKIVTTLNPAVKLDRKYKLYQEGLSMGAFCKLPNGKLLRGVSWSGWSVYPDFTNLDVRKWWQEQYQMLLKEGISGIWHDMNEPVSFAGWGDKTLPVTTEHFMEGQGGDHLEAHNIYGLLMNKAGHEGIKECAPDKRPWILSRSGWAGSQKYAWSWTGDIETSWGALQQTIPTILGLGLSGHAFSGVDIGGFSGSPGAELYLRWFQLATFLPFFRTHSAIGTKPREPWLFGEPTTSIVRKFLKLRYKLMPYLYSLAWETAQSGYPLIRPLYWNNPQDLGLWDIEDEFLLGESLLIAPIVNESATKRQISLPQGIWYSYWDDQRYIGPMQLEYPVSYEMIPIFIKGGTLLPMEDDGELFMHVYPGLESQTTSHLYLDSGDGYAASRLDTFHMGNKQNSMVILWETTGAYPFPYPTTKIQVHGNSLSKAKYDSSSCHIQDNTILVPKFQTLSLEFEQN